MEKKQEVMEGVEYQHLHEHTEHSEGEHLSSGKHVHVMEDGTVIEHVHTHTHAHTHQNTKAVLNRLSRAIGHLESVKKMVEDGRDCTEVLTQLSAVRAALNNTGKVILHDHINHCIVDAVESGDQDALVALNKAIDQFIK